MGIARRGSEKGGWGGGAAGKRRWKKGGSWRDGRECMEGRDEGE